MKKYYESKGYIYKDIDSDYMEVKIEDLPLTSNAKVEVVCDFCGKETDAFKVEVDLDNKIIKV